MESGIGRLPERYQALLHSFMGLVVKGSRDYDWAIAKLQAAIDEPNPPVEIPGLDYINTKFFLNDWEAGFPRRGRAIMKLMAPFYSPHLSFELKHPRPDLEKFAKELQFLHPCSGVAIGRFTKELGELGTHQFPGFEGYLGLYLESFQNRLKREFGEHYPWTQLQICCRQLLITPHMSDAMKKVHWNKNGRNEWQLSYQLVKALGSSLHLAAAATILYADIDFQPLLTLWQSGNLPVGFTIDNRLIVLVAEDSPNPPQRS